MNVKDVAITISWIVSLTISEILIMLQKVFSELQTGDFVVPVLEMYFLAF